MSDVIDIKNEQRRVGRLRQARYRLSNGREDVLGQLDPPLHRDDMTVQEVCDYFGISRSTLITITRRHTGELITVGHAPAVRGRGVTPVPARYSRRSFLHIAMLLRPSTSERGNAITRALGMYREARTHTGLTIPRADHVDRCRTMLERACSVAEDVQELDPADVWRELKRMSHTELQAVVVTLGALLPLDQSDLRARLTKIGARYDPEDAAATGLALLIPPSRFKKAVGE